ncbi:MAG: hypothetical protein QOK19_1701 [Solirubrobacteraceae bacterium]|nr:hypothetical protein [Solirubrobacteraceae bacterium]
MVGDLEDHRFWKMRRDRWALDTVEALSDMTSPAVLHTFERAVSSPAALGDIAEDLPLELEGLRRALAVLLGLQDGPADSHEAARPAP